PHAVCPAERSVRLVPLVACRPIIRVGMHGVGDLPPVIMELMKEVRTRFAPSPTGLLHIGGVRTALFEVLLAHHYGGRALLRIDDTDRERLVPGAVRSLLEDLNWVGLHFDEGP